tara:strand:+ start:140 stop:1180 length:1041 start_codon:yes stop_codon:yes gene_type:complete
MSLDDIKFVYWFTYYNLESPSIRYRGYYPLIYFKEKKGVGFYFVIPGYTFSRIYTFLKAYFSALLFRKDNSIIVVQRVRSNFIYSVLLKFLLIVQSKNTVYDLDDADYLEYPAKQIYSLVKRTQFVSGGSSKICDHLQLGNTKSYHLTSPIVDLGIHKEVRNDLFVVGWIGGFHWGHKKSLQEQCFPALKELNFDVKLTLIGVEKIADQKFVADYFKSSTHIHLDVVKDINWENEEMIQNYIKEFDCGIATLYNTEIQKSKSGFKAKQYMNNGVPVISSNLPENNSVVKHLENGFLCEDVNDFLRDITLLSQMNDDEYWKMSRNARASIVEFNHEYYWKKLQVFNT